MSALYLRSNRQGHRRILLWMLAIIAGILLAPVFSFQQPTKVFGQEVVAPDHEEAMAAGLALFRSDVRTILVGRCLKCHGGESVEGGLDLSTRAGLLLGGDNGKSIDPQAPQASLLLQLIRHTVEPFMPEDGAQLDADQIEVIERWIALGSPYDRPLVDQTDEDPLAWTKKVIPAEARDFWAFRPLVSVAPPAAEPSNAVNEIDRFIQARQRAVGLTSSPAADRRTLLRRAALDLIGLPPSPQQVEQFMNDTDPQAWEHRVDELLRSERYGERWARHWLDLARFAESFGFEQDYDRPYAYHYRDFVIRALNDDMPYNQFVAWQIAGDELAPDEPQALMATGFLGAGVFPTQLTEKEFETARYDELDDMVSTLGTTFLGFTVGCARCHDHKFDPIPSRDYYQLLSVFGNTIRSNVEISLNDQEYQDNLARWRVAHQPLLDSLAQFEKEELPNRFEQFLATLAQAPSSAPASGDWELPSAMTITSAEGAQFQPQDDGSYLAVGANGNQDSYLCTLETLANRVTGLRLDALADPSLPQGGPGRAGNGNIGLSQISVTAAPLDGSSPPVAVSLVDPTVTFQQNDSSLSIAASLDESDQTGWAVDPQFNRSHAVAYRLAAPITFASGTKLAVTLKFHLNTQHNIGRPRLSTTSSDTLPALDAPVAESFIGHLQTMLAQQRDPQQWTLDQRQRLLDLYKTHDYKGR